MSEHLASPKQSPTRGLVQTLRALVCRRCRLVDHRQRDDRQGAPRGGSQRRRRSRLEHRAIPRVVRGRHAAMATISGCNSTIRAVRRLGTSTPTQARLRQSSRSIYFVAPRRSASHTPWMKRRSGRRFGGFCQCGGVRKGCGLYRGTSARRTRLFGESVSVAADQPAFGSLGRLAREPCPLCPHRAGRDPRRGR